MVQPDQPVKTVELYNSPDKGKKTDPKWWNLKGEEVAQSIWAKVSRIVNDQDFRTRRNLFYGSLYENQDLRSFGAANYTVASRVPARTGVTWNVIKAVIDTLTSRVGTNKPKPYALTQNANWLKQQRAKKLSRYLEGMFDRTGMWRKGRTGFRDGCAVGTGSIKIHNTTGQVCVDRVLIEEIVVEDISGYYGEPNELFQKRWVHKEVACAIWPKAAAFIKDAAFDLTVADAGGSQNTPAVSDMIMVIEAWHLRSSKESKDGKRAIIISNHLIEIEDWNIDRFPFVFSRYHERLLGFYGGSLSEDLSGIQLEINKMLRTIAIAQHLMAVPQVWLHINSKVPESHVNNEIGGTKYYDGDRPWFFTPTAMNPETYNYLETLWNRAFEIPGISQMSAAGSKPAGVDSGVAMRTMQDIESDRFKAIQQRYEEMYIDAAYLMIELENELQEKTGNQSVKVSDNKSSETLNWKDVMMDIEDFSIRLWPTNLLPSDPAGKISTAVELMQGGLLDDDEAISLMDYPDIQSVTNLKTAARDDVLRIISNILDKGEYETPEPHMNLLLARKLTQLSYLKARNDNAPSDKLDLLLAFQEDVEAFIEMWGVDPNTGQPLPMPIETTEVPPQAMLPPGPMEGAAPVGQPLPQPVSELMPVA